MFYSHFRRTAKLRLPWYVWR